MVFGKIQRFFGIMSFWKLKDWKTDDNPQRVYKIATLLLLTANSGFWDTRLDIEIAESN